MAEPVAEYVSDSESESEHGEGISAKNRRKKRKLNWEPFATYDTKKEADEVVQSEQIWVYHFRNKTAAGSKIYYRCNDVKKESEQCNAAVYLLFHSNNDKVTLYRTNAQHNHENLAKSCKKLSEETKNEINNLFSLNLKPKKMMEVLTSKGLRPEKKSQLDNYLTRLRTNTYGPSSISLGELEKWCEENSQVPEEDDKGYVVAYAVHYGDGLEESDLDESGKDENENGYFFRIFISTKLLLSNADKSKNFHADATYKLTWEGMPILMLGVTDRDRHFHPLGISVCTYERTEDFKFIFQAIKDGVKIFGVDLDPDHLISDASDAIRNAFIEIFGDWKLLIMCWAHMRRNVTKNIGSLLENTSFKGEIISDIDLLQQCPNEVIFNKAVTLFRKKWKKEDKFIEYMDAQWLSTHRNWYEGAALFTPSTNNALESFNLVIKKEITFRERLPLSRFLNVAKTAVETWSSQYKNKDRIFSISTTIPTSEWTKGYHWVRQNFQMNKKSEGIINKYYIPSEGEEKFSQEDIRNVEQMKYTTFETFRKRAFKVWIVEIKDNDWEKGVCSCPRFLKFFICKHLIGVAIRVKLTKPPAEAKNVPIGQKRKRGRPKLATKALIVD